MTHLQSKSHAIDADHKSKTFSLGNIEWSESKTRSHFKIENYLKNSVFSVKNNESSLELWKKINKRYSTVAQMTKDILSISASDVDVEQLFNTARDVCHYHQNHLNADTIEIIMLLKWYEKLKLATAEQNSSQNSDLFTADKNQEIDVKKSLMNEQSLNVKNENHCEIVWKTDSSEKSDVD